MTQYLGVALSIPYFLGLSLGSLLPDIDHPQASINQKVLPIHAGWMKFIIYTGAGIAMITMLQTKNLGFALLGVFFIGAGISGHRGFTHKVFGISLFLFSTWLLSKTYGYHSFIYGIMLGYILHIVGDRIKDFLSI